MKLRASALCQHGPSSQRSCNYDSLVGPGVMGGGSRFSGIYQRVGLLCSALKILSNLLVNGFD